MLLKEFVIKQEKFIKGCEDLYQNVEVTPSFLEKSTLDNPYEDQFDRHRAVSFSNEPDDYNQFKYKGKDDSDEDIEKIDDDELEE